MARYIVDLQMENHEKFYFIRDLESRDIVLLPTKYLMHKRGQGYPQTQSEEVREQFPII